MITNPIYIDYRVPKQAVHCICCGCSLTTGDGFCPECHTPVGLSEAADEREGAQQFVSVLGASGAGKTVYLGLLLDILSKGPESFRGLAASAFSVALQEQVVTALENRMFPEKTAAEADAWDWLHCQVTSSVQKSQRQIDLITPDFAGEAIAMEISQAGLYPAIRHVVTKSTGLLILCDSLKVRDSGSGEDMFALKLASYIAQSTQAREKANGRLKDPGPAIAIVFTKCDGCPEAKENPAEFAKNNTPRLAEFCRQSFENHAFFAANIVGSSAVMEDDEGRSLRVPFHVEPSGVSEPLQWIMRFC